MTYVYVAVAGIFVGGLLSYLYASSVINEYKKLVADLKAKM